MSSLMAYYFAAFAVLLALNTILIVKTQPTVQDCHNGDSSNILAELNVEAIRQLNEHVQSIRQLLTESNQERKSQQVSVMTSLQAVERRSQEQENYIRQVQSMHELLNASFQQMISKQDTVLTSLQAVERRSQEQDIYIRQVQSMHELLNASFQQIKNQQDTVERSLRVVFRLLLDHDVYIKNQTQNPWELAMEIRMDSGEGPVLLPTLNNWVILMQRFDGSLNFYRNWTEYRNGFGDIGRGEFWLGNEKIHRLTNRFVYTLRIEVQLNATGKWYYADYATFSIDSESNKYALHLSGFSGNAGDSLTNTSSTGGNLGGMSFTSWDADNDRNRNGNCARSHGGGWWFNYCRQACLTCHYNNDFSWQSLRHLSSDGAGRLRAARMMIKTT